VGEWAGIGLNWQMAGFGDFSSRPNETDMIMRNTSTGALEVYDIANNALTSAFSMGAVGLDWQVAGFGDFSSNPNETDMIMRNSKTGAFEVYDIANNALTSAFSMGAVGLNWQVAGFGPMNGAGTSDMVLRNTNTGAFEVYDIANNALTTAAGLGQVGLDWQLGDFAVDPPTASMGDSGQAAQLVQAMAGLLHMLRDLALLLQRNNKHAEAAEYWRRYLANDAQSEWAARARRSLKFCEMQVHISKS
jgi:hypothetical protein